MRSRKNRPHGSVISRQCWCKECAQTCPVHALPRLIAQAGIPLGLIFSGITPKTAAASLRARLGKLGVPNPELYRLHDFRRGHARDLLRRGRKLYEILQAGDWSSPAFLDYLDRAELEERAMVEAHLDEESDED